MTTPQHLENVSEALQAAGRDLAATLAESGIRVSASAALGQVLAGLPDAARGIIAGLSVDYRAKIADACADLYDIARADLPGTKAADADMARTPADEHRAYSLVMVVLNILTGNDQAVSRRIADMHPQDAYRLRQACRAAVNVLDQALAPVENHYQQDAQ